jgi:hypothetical protein
MHRSFPGLFVAALAVGFVAAVATQAEQPPTRNEKSDKPLGCCGSLAPGAAGAQHKDLSKHKVHDGLRLLGKEQLAKDGPHRLHVPESKLHVVATVKGGKITGIEATDPNGKAVPGRWHRELREVGVGVVVATCWYCVEDPTCGCSWCVEFPCVFVFVVITDERVRE